MSVSPGVSRLKPWDDENYQGDFIYECDSCAYPTTGITMREADKTPKKVKWKFGAILCRECYRYVKVIADGIETARKNDTEVLKEKDNP